MHVEVALKFVTVRPNYVQPNLRWRLPNKRAGSTTFGLESTKARRCHQLVISTKLGLEATQTTRVAANIEVSLAHMGRPPPNDHWNRPRMRGCRTNLARNRPNPKCPTETLGGFGVVGTPARSSARQAAGECAGERVPTAVGVSLCVDPASVGPPIGFWLHLCSLSNIRTPRHAQEVLPGTRGGGEKLENGSSRH